METTNETDFASKTLKELNEICTRYDNMLTRLESHDEDDDEERWLLKEATKSVIAGLEKQAIPKTKQVILMTRMLNVRMQNLIERCERAFPQLEELVHLKSIQVEVDALLSKAATSSLPNCPLCLRFGGYRLFAKGAGESENIFLYVAEKIAASRKVMVKGSKSAGLGRADDDDDHDDIIGRGKRRKKKSQESKPESEMDELEVPHAATESDTQAEVTPTIPSDPSREEDKEHKRNLLWMEDDLDVDIADYQRPHRRRSRKHGSRHRTREPPAMDERRQTPPQDRKSCIFCTRPEGAKRQEIAESRSPTPEERPVDLIVSAPVSAPPDVSMQAQEKAPSTNRTSILLLVSTIFVLNLLVQGILWVCGCLTSTTSWPGSAMWPFYCKVANGLCKADYEFACTDYCASRLDRFLWGKK